MTPWVRLDDAFHSHRKRRRAGHEAIGLWTAALSYCGFYLTDGFVDNEWLEQEIPHASKRQKLVGSLVKAKLFERVAEGQVEFVDDRHGEPLRVGPFPDDGYLIHNFLRHNPSRSEVEDRRAKERRKKRGQRDLSPGDTPRDTGGTA